MSEAPKEIKSIEVPTNPQETWAMTSGYGVTSAVFMGAAVYEGDVAVLFVKGSRGGKTNGIRMQTEALDRFCEAWLQSQKVKSSFNK